MTHHAPGSAYILTEDLGEKITAFRHVGLETPDPTSALFLEIQDELAHALQAAVGDEHPVKRIKMRDLSDEIIARISRTFGDNVLVVSTCPEIGQPSKGMTVEVNRLVDKQGTALGLGPRPGHPPLRTQMYDIADRANMYGVPIVIAEDGMFVGETMRHVVTELEAVRADVSGIVAGFTFSQGPVKELAEHHVQVEVIHDFGPILDWVPDHDFLPFTPGSGKVLGTKIGERTYPFYDHQHSSFSLSYIAPFGPVQQWASIPSENVNSFSTACLQLTIKLFTELEKLNGRKINIDDIVPSRQRVSIPISLDSSDRPNNGPLPSRETRVIDFLAETL